MDLMNYNKGQLGLISEVIETGKDVVNFAKNIVSALDTGPAQGPQNRKAAAGIYALMALGYTPDQIRNSPALMDVVRKISDTSVWNFTIDTIQKTAPSKIAYLLKQQSNIPTPAGYPFQYRVLTIQESIDLLNQVLGYLVNTSSSGTSTPPKNDSASSASSGSPTTSYSDNLTQNNPPPAPKDDKKANAGWILGIAGAALGIGLLTAGTGKTTSKKTTSKSS